MSFRFLNTHKARRTLSQHKTVQYSALLFDHLAQCVDILNDSLWIQMLLAVCGIYMYNLFTMFGLYRLLMSYSAKLRSTIFSRLLWNSAYLIFLSIITSISQLIKCEAAGLLTNIQQLLQDQKNPWSFVDTVSWWKLTSLTFLPIQFNQLQNLAVQIEHKVPAASCKLFDYDLDFLATVRSDLLRFSQR